MAYIKNVFFKNTLKTTLRWGNETFSYEPCYKVKFRINNEQKQIYPCSHVISFGVSKHHMLRSCISVLSVNVWEKQLSP